MANSRTAKHSRHYLLCLKNCLQRISRFLRSCSAARVKLRCCQYPPYQYFSSDSQRYLMGTLCQSNCDGGEWSHSVATALIASVVVDIVRQAHTWQYVITADGTGLRLGLAYRPLNVKKLYRCVCPNTHSAASGAGISGKFRSDAVAIIMLDRFKPGYYWLFRTNYITGYVLVVGVQPIWAINCCWFLYR